jgi:hypothetical protein
MIWGSAVSVPAVSGGMLLLLSVLMMVVGYRLAKRERAPRWLLWMTGLGAALLPIAVVQAATFTVPFIFSNGTTADATQVNQNFAPIATAIDKLTKPVAVITECQYQTRDSLAQRNCAFGQGGAAVTNGSDSALVAPLQVPSGALITSVEVWVADTNASANISVCLWALFDDFGSFDTSIPCAVSSGTPGITKLTLIPSSPPATRQGGGKSYELFVFTRDNAGTVINWPTGFNLAARTAYVHYETP